MLPFSDREPEVDLCGMAVSSGHRNLLKARTFSPAQNLLSPNDDASERARARADRAAAQRRKFLPPESATESESQAESDLLPEDIVANLLEKCLKLAAENKINEKNTWELPLIDHLSDVFKNNDNQDAQCNFQMASCGLEAGVRIYATRVDSAHSQAFKALVGISHSSKNAKQADGSENADEAADNEGDIPAPKQTSHKKGDSTTLAPSFDSITVKKFEMAFAVDPLFHLTSAQFDEGGAKGLLLNNLSVYRYSELVFDSMEIPERRMKAENVRQDTGKPTIDLSFMQDSINQMMAGLAECPVITPTLREILSELDDPVRAAAEAEMSREGTASCRTWASDPAISSVEDDTYDGPPSDCYVESVDQAGCNDMDDDMDPFFVEDDHVPSLSPVSSSVKGDDGGSVYDEEVESSRDQDDDDTLGWLIGSRGLDPKSNAWAGPDHWKFRKNDEATATETDEKASGKGKRKPRKQAEQFVVDVDMEVDETRFLTPEELEEPKSSRRVNLRQTTVAQRRRTERLNLLPEDCHYKALDLVQLFLRPVVRTQKQRKRRNGGVRRDPADAFPRGSTVAEIWDEVDSFETGDADDWQDGSPHNEGEDSTTDLELVPEPRKVQKVFVNYDKSSKQVDVHRLKESMWDHFCKGTDRAEDSHEGEAEDTTTSSSSGSTAQEDGNERIGVSFQDLLDGLAEETPSEVLSNASVALCLICLLHLANEHGLSIQHSPSLDEVIIR